MSKHPDRDEAGLTHDAAASDPLAEVYTEMVSPDIAEINDHAAALAEEADPDHL
ncbi:hypothetical protein [Arthrobacter sp. ERGS1:01]|uniref:hypothetical protein n=1 Tax=Arthrobacter sp. ERGS1:01 TaxID=1704044 RepID=UPI000A96EF4C|nr:hypothetical protein [Arthrobacter sp. ERGS1:01]